MISNANLLVKQGLLKRPLDFGFVMGDYISLYVTLELPITPYSPVTRYNSLYLNPRPRQARRALRSARYISLHLPTSPYISL